ncbi:uncharacterized protein LOC135391295 isoform X3 [Ornithodoros turicata]|uniref:uncharacterized protein LOC135391295 isoform X3 n=1 Tax=Ornithodoros turicata TaxID=34597 RepID=UPI0031397166
MSASAGNTENFTFLQMQVLAKARAAPGIHVILTNPFVAVVGEEGEPTVCKLPRGIVNGTFVTHVFRFPDLKTAAKYRFRKDDGLHGDLVGPFVEYYASPGNRYIYQRNVANELDHTHLGCIVDDKAPCVLQMDVRDNGDIMVSCNGGQETKAPYPNFSSDAIRQTYDGTFDSLTLMEMHVTYKSDVNTVFDTSKDFTQPEFNMYPGGYIVCEGSATETFEIKRGAGIAYTGTRPGSGLRLVMKTFATSYCVELVGQDSQSVPYAGPTYTTPFVVSSEFHLTSFTMETGGG